MSRKEELEARLKEQRLAEATKKGLMGATGKIGTVLKFMGSPVVSQTEDISYLDTQGFGGDGPEGPMGMPMMDIEGASRPSGPEWSEDAPDPVSFGTRDIGRHFDGLGRGMHLEIFYKEESSEMSVLFRGHLVYREIQGELLCYVPHDEWEGWISSLFKIAKKVQRDAKEEEFQSRVQEAERNKESWLRDIAARWGFT